MKTQNNKRKQTRKEPQQVINLKKKTVHELYDMAEKEYQRLSSQQQNKWNTIISQSGTKKDKISLMATEIIKNPHTSLSHFEQLAKSCYNQNHHFSLDACRALANIYNDYVFADKQKLSIFVDSIQKQIKQGKNKCIVSKEDLVGYYLEHHIKHYYSELIKSLQVIVNTSTISFVKKASINLLTSLTRHSQLRRYIINILINKFGDHDLEIVNQIYKSLKNEFYQDIQSSGTLLQEAQTFLFRTNISRKSQFYVINFLNNLNMKFLNQKGLSKLFQLFYHFFEKLMSEDNNQNSVSSRLFLNSIKGLNKIFTFIKGGNKQTKSLIQSKIQSIYKIIHKTSNTKAKIQLYLFLFQYHSHIHGNLTDRYYRSLYDFINHDEILHCSLGQLFFDLILISIKQDDSLNRILAFIKRILQLCFTAQSNFIVTTLIMIGNIFEEKQSLKVMINQKENCLADELEQDKNYDPSKRQPLYARAQNTLIWQLTLYTNHYHPTVRKYALHLMKGQKIPYYGENPLLQLSTASFLQKIALKKQKKSDSWKLKMKKHLSKIRKSKYETLIDKPLQSFKEDQSFIKQYLEQRSSIHTNFKKRQTNDIQEFADQVIQKQMNRLNPKDENLDLSLSDINENEDDNQFQSQDNFQDNQFEDNQQNFEDEQFGQQNDEDEQFDEQFDEDDNQQQDMQSQSKQFLQVFNEIGKDDDNYPKKQKNAFKKNTGKRGPTKEKKKIKTKIINKKNKTNKLKR